MISFQKILSNQLHPFGITVDYPGEGTIFPPEFPAPEFLWKDTLNTPATLAYTFFNTKRERVISQNCRIAIMEARFSSLE